MFPMIQTLERRMLMSATLATLTSDVAVIDVDIRAVTSAQAARDKADQAALSGLAAALRKVDTNSVRSANNDRLSALDRQMAVYRRYIIGDVNRLLAAARSASGSAFAHGKSLAKTPTSAAARKLVAKDIATISAKVPAANNALQPEIVDQDIDSYEVSAQSAALANPAIAGFVAVSEDNILATSAVLSGAAARLQTASAQFATDLGTI